MNLTRHRRSGTGALLIACLTALGLASSAYADDSIDGPEVVVAVQERDFRMKHELTLGLGVLPLDSYYKGIAAQLGYTHHFSDRFAWQIGRGLYSYNVPTSLRSQLEERWGAEPDAFSQVQWLVGSDLMWTPFYGKTAGLNRSLFYFEAFLLGGGSLARMSDGFAPGAHVGVGARVFTGDRVSFRLDASDHVLAWEGVTHVPTVQLSAAFNFGGTEDSQP